MADGRLAGGRLDAVLAKAFPAFSRSRIKALILTGAVTINGKPPASPSTKLREGDALTLIAPAPGEAEPEPENIPLDMLYEDEQLIVINKPVGMVVHPAPGNSHGTLVNALLYHCGASLEGIGGVKRPGIVHRLDKDTSGVMVAAKTDAAHTPSGRAVRRSRPHRPAAPRLYRLRLGRDGTGRAALSTRRSAATPNNRLKQAVRKDGREAITHYRRRGPLWRRGLGHHPASAANSKPAAPTRSASTWPISATRWSPIRSMPPAMPPRSTGCPSRSSPIVQGLGRQALHAAELGFEHPVSGRRNDVRGGAPA